MKHIAITDFLTPKEIDEAAKLYADCRKVGATFAVLCERQIITPVLDRINEALGQENDARFLAYMVEYVMSLTWDNR